MARRLFFVDSVRQGHAAIEGEDARHLRKVLRAEVGQKYEISDNRNLYLAEIDSLGKDLISFRVLENLAADAPPVRVTVYAALIKFDRFEWMLEKATELGVEAIVPVETARAETGLERGAVKRLDRWRRIVLESSQQSRRALLPAVAAPVSFEDALNAAAAHRLFLEEERHAPPLLAALPSGRAQPDQVALLVGPEGGWVDYERNAAHAAGWNAVSLGPGILRAETAAIAALAIVIAAWQGVRQG